MALAEVGSFACPASTGDQTVNLSRITNPKVLLLWTTGRTAAGSGGGHARWSWGMATYRGSTAQQFHMAGTSADAASTASTHGRSSMTKVLCLGSGNSTTVAASAGFVSFASTSFTINWDTVSSGVLVNYVALGGDDVLDALVGTTNWTLAYTGGTQDVTVASGFGQPHLVMFGMDWNAGDTLAAADWQHSLGFGMKAAGANGRGLMFTSGHAESTQLTGQRISNALAAVAHDQRGAFPMLWNWGLSASSAWPTDGFEVTAGSSVSTSSYSPWPFFWLAVKFSANVTVTVGETAARTTTGTTALTAANAPELALLLGTMQTTANAYDATSATAAEMSVGAVDGAGTQRTAGVYDDDAQATASVTGTWQASDSTYRTVTTSSDATDSIASGSVSGTNFQLDFSDAAASAWLYEWLTLAAPAGGATVTGSASLDATAVVAVVPQRVVQRQATVGATAAVAAVPQRVVQRQATVGATAALAVVGGRPTGIVGGAADIAATAAIAAAPQRTVQRSADIVVTTAVTAAGAGFTQIVTGQAALAATALIAASGASAAATSTAVARVSLGPGGEPATRTAHAVNFRARMQSAVGTVTLRAALYEGATNRSGELESAALTTSVALYTLAIDDANAANITSYSDLELRFWAYSPNGSTATVEVEEAWLETPDVTVTVVTGTAAVAATGTIAATGRNVSYVSIVPAVETDEAAWTTVNQLVFSPAALDATASVAAVPRRIAQRQVDIAATASVAVVPQRTVQRQASVDATAIINAAATTEGLVTGQASLDATASVGAAGRSIVVHGVASLLAAADVRIGNLYPAADIYPSASLFSGQGIGVMRGFMLELLRQVALASQASIDATPSRVVQRQVDIAAATAVDVTLQRIVQRQVAIAAAATVNAAGIKSGLATGQVQIAATTAVDVVPQRTVQRQAAISATADVVAVGARVANVVTGQATLSATADVAVAPQRTVQRAASLDATSSVSAIGIKVGLVTGQVSISATGGMSATPQRVVFRQASVDATASISSTAISWSTVTADGAVQATATVAAAGVALQVLRPFADSVDGDWTTDSGSTNLVGAISEGVPDDGTYIHSGAASPSTCRIKLSGGQIPVAGSRVLRLRAGNEAPGADLTVRLREGGGDVVGGGLLVNEFVHTDIGLVGLIEDTVTGTIVDYSDLYVELEAS